MRTAQRQAQASVAAVHGQQVCGLDLRRKTVGAAVDDVRATIDAEAHLFAGGADDQVIEPVGVDVTGAGDAAAQLAEVIGAAEHKARAAIASVLREEIVKIELGSEPIASTEQNHCAASAGARSGLRAPVAQHQVIHPITVEISGAPHLSQFCAATARLDEFVQHDTNTAIAPVDRTQIIQGEACTEVGRAENDVRRSGDQLAIHHWVLPNDHIR